VALVDVRKEDASELESLAKIYRANFNDNADIRKQIGGNKFGFKSQMKIDRAEAKLEKESIRKARG